MWNVGTETSWLAALVLLALLAAVGFGVSWTSDLLRLRRGPYIGVLAIIAAASTGAVVWSTGVGMADFVGHHWERGLIAAAITGIILGVGIRRTPSKTPRTGRALHEAEAWEGVVYGIAEGLLLSALPAFVAWQAATDAGWSDRAAWFGAMAASGTVIVIHHLGYWDFRNVRLAEALFGCLVLTVGFLASGSILAPVVGHVVMHIAGVTKGVELPPHPRTAYGVGAGR